MQPPDTNSNEGIAREAAARASFLRMTPGKWYLIRIFEALVRFLQPLVPAPRPVENPAEKPGSILVIEYWNLGDLAILMPFLRSLRLSFPLARISLLVDVRFKSFLEGQGIVDEFIPVRVPWAQHFSRWRKYNPFSPHWISFARVLLALRKRRFDWAFSGRMDVRDNFMLWLSAARRRIAYGLGGGGSFLTDRVVPDLSRPHRMDIWLHLLKAIGESPVPGFGGFRLLDGVVESTRSYLAGLGIPSSAFLIGVHPGARIAARRWGEGRFSELVSRVLSESSSFHVLWFSEPGTPSRVPQSERCHTVSLDFEPFLAVLSRCRLLVCNDSGPMHLANLLGVPVVAIFGSQRPEWFGPRGREDRVVFRPEVWCRPCFDYCIFGQPYCLRLVSVDDVYNAVKQTLQLTDSKTAETIAANSLNGPTYLSHPGFPRRRTVVPSFTRGREA